MKIKALTWCLAHSKCSIKRITHCWLECILGQSLLKTHALLTIFWHILYIKAEHMHRLSQQFYSKLQSFVSLKGHHLGKYVLSSKEQTNKFLKYNPSKTWGLFYILLIVLWLGALWYLNSWALLAWSSLPSMVKLVTWSCFGIWALLIIRIITSWADLEMPWNWLTSLNRQE